MRASGEMVLGACLMMTACGSEVPAVVTVELRGSESQAGACPTPPGESRDCFMEFHGKATFREHAGTAARVEGVAVIVCYGENCYRYGPDGGQAASSFELAGNASRAVSLSVPTIGHPDIRVAAMVTSEGHTYPVEASFQRVMSGRPTRG